MLSVKDPCQVVPVWYPVQVLLLQTSHLGHYITLNLVSTSDGNAVVNTTADEEGALYKQCSSTFTLM